MLIRIRHLLTSLWYRLTSPAYRLLQKSGFFDPGYYLANNPDVAASGAEPLAHYLTKGFAELRRPGPLFDGKFYLHQYPGLVEKGQNPLLHFLQKGRYQGLVPNFLVDPEYYALENPSFDAGSLDPLSHFLSRSDDQGQSPSPYFDPRFYCRTYPDAALYASAPRAAYNHFLSIGLAQHRQPSVYFDTAFYLDKAPGLREFGLDPLSHYFMFGFREKKSPSPLFDAVFYGKIYSLKEDSDPFGHYLRNQKRKDRPPCPWFDPLFYRQASLGGGQDTSPFEHFLQSGLKDRLYPNRQIFDLATKPVISVIVPVYNVEIAHLNNCIRSVVYQSYPHWELCLADDCSTDQEIRPLLAGWAATDPRIKIVFLAENSGISAATNAAAKLAGGSYLAFLDNDDELAPEALQTFAQRINSTPADLYYSDEDLIGADGRRFSVFRKPGFNSELLLCHNYVTHCVVTKKSLYDQVGGCAGEQNGAQDLDLFLKLSEQADTVVHIPQVLYHWRASESSTSINHDKKHYADEAGRKSVADALARRDIAGEALFTDWKFFYRAKRSINRELSVTLVIRWERKEGDIFAWLNTLLVDAGFKVSQMVLLMNKQIPSSSVDALANATGIAITCRVMPDSLGPAEKFQAVLADIQGELVVFVNGDLHIDGDHWLSALVEYGQDPEVGMVCGRIEYSVTDADTVTPIPDCANTSPRYYVRFLTECSVLMNGRNCSQEVIGVSDDLFLLRRDLLTAANGFDTAHFPYLFPFVDFSFRLHQHGKKNIYTPYCKATKTAEGATRDNHWPPAALQNEKAQFQDKWFDFLNEGDPFYNRGIISDKARSEDEFRSWLTGQGPPASQRS